MSTNKTKYTLEFQQLDLLERLKTMYIWHYYFVSQKYLQTTSEINNDFFITVLFPKFF